jgi:hypothetical protein
MTSATPITDAEGGLLLIHPERVHPETLIPEMEGIIEGMKTAMKAAGKNGSLQDRVAKGAEPQVQKFAINFSYHMGDTMNAFWNLVFAQNRGKNLGSGFTIRIFQKH